MRRLKAATIGILGLMMMLVGQATAQKSIEIGGFIGTSYYNGDINPAMPFNEPQLSYGGLVRLNFNPRWSMRLNVYAGKVTADDNKVNYVSNRELSFETSVTDISAIMEFNFLEYFVGSKRNFFTPYIFGGIGFVFFNPRSLDGQDLQALGTEGQNIGFDGRSPYNKNSLTIPFGFGFKYSVNKRIGVAVEWGMRKTFTDYIDDVSTTYYLNGEAIDPNSPGQILSDPTMSHSPGMQRGNDKTNDWLGFAGISVTYKINLISRSACLDYNKQNW